MKIVMKNSYVIVVSQRVKSWPINSRVHAFPEILNMYIYALTEVIYRYTHFSRALYGVVTAYVMPKGIVTAWVFREFLFHENFGISLCKSAYKRMTLRWHIKVTLSCNYHCRIWTKCDKKITLNAWATSRMGRIYSHQSWHWHHAPL